VLDGDSACVRCISGRLGPVRERFESQPDRFRCRHGFKPGRGVSFSERSYYLKIDFEINAWTPFVASTTCVTLKSIAALDKK
jgi:hypothetical protein